MPNYKSKGFPLAGVHAYAERSVAAGENVHFRISSPHPYQLSIYKLGSDPNGPSHDQHVLDFPVRAARAQNIVSGSYVVVQKGLNEALESFTAECWVRPWYANIGYRWQGVLTQHDYPNSCAFGLFIHNGRLKAYLGDGGAWNASWATNDNNSPPIQNNVWYHVALVWSGKVATLFLDGNDAVSWPFAGPFLPQPTPILLGAYYENSDPTDLTLNGDIAMPALYSRALTPAEIRARWSECPSLPPKRDSQLLACWPLCEERGENVKDIGPHNKIGKIINYGSWMIGGPRWEITEDDFHNPDYDPRNDKKRGNGLRFAEDDLYDCNWEVTDTFGVPLDASSGLYVGRIKVGDQLVHEVPFIIRSANTHKKSNILVICSTNTWLAYSQPFGPEQYGPKFSCYVRHQYEGKGQSTFQVGLNMPLRFKSGAIPNAVSGEPTTASVYALSSNNVDYSHLLRAERFLHIWLDHEGYDYDMAADHDIDRYSDLLDGYEILVINGHSEYWSLDAWKQVDAFLNRGGKAIVLSGNTAYWRVSFDKNFSVMECRKPSSPPFLGGTVNRWGELWHSHDFLRGGLLREHSPGQDGYPCWKLLGLESSGYTGVAKDDFDGFTVADADHPLFNTPNKTGVRNGDVLGIGRAVGHEWAARITHLLPEQIPDWAQKPIEPPGIETLAEATRKGNGLVIDYYCSGGNGPQTVSEMVHWKRPTGGEIFYAGSIGVGWALPSDDRLQNLLRNVLARFGVAPAKAQT
jgi:N,N-dimethylformamidase